MQRSSLSLAALFFILAIWFRLPTVHAGLPYFYDEDEAHHFNRVVNMMKSGDFDPHYFHKPSLHFYLRLPITAAAFLWSVKNGDLQSVREITTTDPRGVAKYAFSVSHPRLLVWNRLFSVILSSGMIFFLFLLMEEITFSRRIAFVATLLAIVCPELIRYSGTVGVDSVMGFFAVLSVYLCAYGYRRRDRSCLLWGAFTAGLAVSSKYNALPILIVPVLGALFLGKQSLQSFALALIISGAAFLMGSPYILKEFPTFLDHFGYEIWHYKIAGHEGHMANPGWEQFKFYISWLSNDALGVVATALGLLGMLIVPKYGRAGVIYGAFPILFFVLMVDQRANFTRNMVPFLPFFCGGVAIAAAPFFSRKRYVTIAAAALLCFVPLRKTLALRYELTHTVESRSELATWQAEHPEVEVAVDDRLQVAPSLAAERTTDLHPLFLWMHGYQAVAVGPEITPESIGTIEQEFPGDSTLGRIVKNPLIRIVTLRNTYSPQELREYMLGQAPEVTLAPSGDHFACKAKVPGELCWVQSRFAKVAIEGLTNHPNFSGRDGVIKLGLTVMSPWSDQQAKITFDDFLAYVTVPLKDLPGKWQEVQLELPYAELKDSQYFIISVNEIHSPKRVGINGDTRHLGLAMSELRIVPR